MTGAPNATHAPDSPAEPRPNDRAGTDAAARLCWHTIALCRALDRGVGELQAAIADAAEHADAILEMGVALIDTGPNAATAPTGPERS